MKVAVSMPDALFREAEAVSRRLRVPRSQLYSRALEAFARRHSGEKVTARLDAVIAALDPSVANVSQLTVSDRRRLVEKLAALPGLALSRLDEGLRVVLGL